jgi:hypothetical protein
MGLKETVLGYRMDSSGSGVCPVVGPCSHGNEPSGFSKCEELFEHLRDYQIHNNTNICLCVMCIVVILFLFL